jgi:hypothetical protein
MTLASLFRPAAAPEVLPGRHAAPDLGDEERYVAASEARPGRHAADEAPEELEDASFEDESLAEEFDEEADLLGSLGFDYEDDAEDD